MVFHLSELPIYRHLGRALAGLPQRWRRRAAAVRPVPPSNRLSAGEQWQRLSLVLNTAISDADRAGSLQTRAAQQLDLATYALYNLVDELSSVVREPLGRGKASIHSLEPVRRMAGGSVLAA